MKLNEFIIATFFTKNTPYEEVYHTHLSTSLDKYAFFREIVQIENKGSWRENVAQKPKIILDLLERTSGPIVFLDCDATIEQYPHLFHTIPLTYDIAFHYLSWEDWYGYKGDKTKELLTGTLFVRNNNKMKLLCEQWYNEAKTKHEWEQKSLARILSKRTDIKVYHLPLSYCYIKTRPRGQEPLIKLEPIILHHQCSRQLKKLIR